MSSRKVRNLVLVALVVGVVYWIYKDRPTVSGIVDTITDPLLGSRAAVKSSERNRVVGDASAAISEQTELPVGSLREGMTSREVVELLGEPDSRENAVVDGVKSVKWTYDRAHRHLTFQERPARLHRRHPVSGRRRPDQAQSRLRHDAHGNLLEQPVHRGLVRETSGETRAAGARAGFSARCRRRGRRLRSRGTRARQLPASEP